MESFCSTTKINKKIRRSRRRAIQKINAASFRKILAEKAILPQTGGYDSVFKQIKGKLFLCGICGCNFLFGEIRQHVAGKRHNRNLRKCRNIERSLVEGEPLPEGYGDKHSFSSIQDTMDQFGSAPLLGLEYIVEIVHEAKIKSALFLCTLCNKKGNTGMAIMHVTGLYHKALYIKNHFPTAFRHFGCEYTHEINKVLRPAVDGLARAIEAKYGRLKLTQVDAKEFWENKKLYFNVLHDGQHISESLGETFENLVAEELSKVLDNSQNPHIKEAVGNKDREREFLCEDRKIDSSPNQLDMLTECAEDETDLYSDKKDHHFINKLDMFYKFCKEVDVDMEKKLIKHKKNPEDHPQYNEEWKKFWTERYTDLKARGKDTSTYDFTPEWKEFWYKRLLELHYEETESKKIALRGMLDLQDEPIPITRYTGPNEGQKVELHGVLLSRNSSREKSRSKSPRRSPHYRESSRYKQLSPHHRAALFCRESPSFSRDSSPRFRESAPFSRDSPPCFKESTSSLNRYSPPCLQHGSSPGKDFPLFRKSASNSRDSLRHKDDPSHYRECPSSSRKPSPYRIESPLSHRDYRKYERSPVRDRTSKRDRIRKMPDEMSKFRGDSSGTIRRSERMEPKNSYNKCSGYMGDVETEIVVLLRLLTGLEERLGSLGPKVINLLSNAQIMEKKKLNSAEKLLENEANCVLLETVGEKLKGQLQAGLVDAAQEGDFRNAIKDIKTAIYTARRRKEHIKKQKNLMETLDISVNKEKISRKIVNTLIAQGRKDITQEDLDEMVRAVNEEKEKDSSILVDIGLDYQYSFHNENKTAARKIQEDKNTKTTNTNNTNMDQSSNREINIISGIPANSITINEFTVGSTFGNAEDFYRQNQAKQQETRTSRRDLCFQLRNSQPIPPGTTKPYDVSSTTLPRFGSDRNPKWSIGSSLLVKPLGFPNNPANESLLRGGASSKQPIPKKISFERKRRQSEFRPERDRNQEGELTVPRSGIRDFRDGLSNHRVAQNVDRVGFGNFDSNDYKRMTTSSRGNLRNDPANLGDGLRSNSNFAGSVVSKKFKYHY